MWMTGRVTWFPSCCGLAANLECVSSVPLRTDRKAKGDGTLLPGVSDQLLVELASEHLRGLSVLSCDAKCALGPSYFFAPAGPSSR